MEGKDVSPKEVGNSSPRRGRSAPFCVGGTLKRDALSCSAPDTVQVGGQLGHVRGYFPSKVAFGDIVPSRLSRGHRMEALAKLYRGRYPP